MNRLKLLRAEQNVRQRDLAASLGINVVTLSRYETGLRQMDSSTIIKLCDYFHVTSDYLLGRSPLRETVMAAEDVALVSAYHSTDSKTRIAVDVLLGLNSTISVTIDV